MHLSLAGMMLTAEYISPITGCGNITNRAICQQGIHLIQNGDRDNKQASVYRYKGKHTQFISGNREVTPAEFTVLLCLKERISDDQQLI